MTSVWSFGGGVQSVAMAVYIARGLLPKPQRVVMADTGRESILTWDYTSRHTIPLLKGIGLQLEIIPHTFAECDLYDDSDGHMLALPAFTTSGSEPGKLGKFPVHCSSKWKTRAIRRYLREHGFGQHNPIEMWIGMSLDEVHRMRKSDVKWIENRYPLCLEYKRRRFECAQDITDFGLPLPAKSACWMCPNRSNAEWREQARLAPADHAKAVEMDKAIRDRDPQHAIYLHRSGVPLDQVDFSEPENPQSQLGECAGICWI